MRIGDCKRKDAACAVLQSEAYLLLVQNHFFGGSYCKCVGLADDDAYLAEGPKETGMPNQR